MFISFDTLLVFGVAKQQVRNTTKPYFSLYAHLHNANNTISNSQQIKTLFCVLFLSFLLDCVDLWWFVVLLLM
ncbi:hypothetical protein [Helicobacter sp. T3_23-1056]